MLEIKIQHSSKLKRGLRKVREHYVGLQTDLSIEIVAEVAVELDNQEKLTKEYSIIIFYSADFR